MLSEETQSRTNTDLSLQEQIDAINSQTDVVDVIGTYANLLSYDISEHDINENDIVKILDDSSHNDAISYWRWSINEPGSGEYIDALGGGYWIYIGSQGPFYTKSETDSDFAKKNDVYTKAQSDTEFASKDNVYTITEADNNFLKKADMFKTLWTGLWNVEGYSMTVPDTDKYHMFLLTLEERGTVIPVFKHGTYIRGVGGYDTGYYGDNRYVSVTYHFNATFSGNVWTFVACNEIVHYADGNHSARPVINVPVTSIIGVI